MKLIAKCTITNGVKTFNQGDIFDTDKDFTEALVPDSAEYVEPTSDDVDVPENLDELTVKELKAICKKMSINDTNGKSKEELINVIELAVFDAQEGQ